MAGNWKMFKNAAETAAFFEKFLPLVAASTHCGIAICPPFVNLPAALQATKGSRVGIGGQNVAFAREGAYTGEVSAPMLKAICCEYVIIGHSERRQYFGETDDSVLQKTILALESGLKPIVCVGERLEERESGATENVLLGQFRSGISRLSADQFAQLVIAYEPVWAIGTGKTATPDIAADAHRFLRSQIRNVYGDAADNARILYGGSVKPDNVKNLMAQPEIDGALVGGASLDPAGFASIVNF
jgi:triosephosphate isomerase